MASTSTTRTRPGHAWRDSNLPEQKELRVHMLGELLLECDHTPVLTAAWSKQKPVALLEILLTFRNTTVPKDRLIEWLWPSVPIDSAANSLRVSVRLLRRQLEPLSGSGLSSDYIRTRHEGYCFEGKGAWVDADEFQSEYNSAVREAAGGDLDGAQAHLESCVALYRGDYLQNAPYAEWARPERQRLRGLYLSALAGLANIHALAGRYENAILLCEQILTIDECHEVTYSLLMRCQYAAGDRVGAVRTFEKCRVFLGEKMNLSPMPETASLYRLIVDNETEPSLDFALNLSTTLADR